MAANSRSQTECEWLPEAEKQFEEIAGLAAAWDSHGAEPPDPRVLSAARRFVRRLCDAAVEVPAPRIYPTPSGGAQFEWESDMGYFEIEFLPEAAVACFFQDNRAATEEEFEMSDVELAQETSLGRIIDHIQRVYAG